MAVLLLDDNDDLRMVMSELLLTKGATCIGARSLAEVVELGARCLKCQLAILDVNLGPGCPSGVDAYRWLKEQSFAGRIVFLTGHARTYPGVAEAHALGVKVMEKPVAVADLLKLLDSPRS
jgi:DNA-binding response OmpR family regulator